MIKAIIFDLDGVIIDSEGQWFQAGKELCADYGHEYTKELYKKAMGGNGPRAIKNAFNLEDSEEEVFKKLVAKFISLVEKHGTKEMPGIRSLLDRTKKNLLLALASSSPRDRIDFFIDKLNLRNYFSVIMSGSQVSNTKPEPDIFLATAEKLEVEPSECIVIEDSPNGTKAAKAAGMKCIALKNPYASENDLQEAGADLIVSNLDEITENVLKDLP
jgi:HAD superfamily hydrolase (TIGR01509 family)